LWVPIGAVVALAVNQPIVHYVAEPRPYSGLDHILVLAHRGNDPSFPSDHAVMAGAVAAGLWLLNRRLAIIAALAALLMAAARVYIAAHYPSDVGAGLLLGATICLTGYALQDPALARIIGRLRRSQLRPLLTTSGPSPTQDTARQAEHDTSEIARPTGTPSPAAAEHRPPKETNSQ
jgi:membrane-associated phospholipid phosphatase